MISKKTFNGEVEKFLNEEILGNPPLSSKEMRLLDEILIKILRESNQQIRDELRAFLKRWEIRTLAVDALYEAKVNEQIQKLQAIKTGDSVTLTGYAVFDEEGKDTGKRFIRREDAEKYSEAVYGRQNKTAVSKELIVELQQEAILEFQKIFKDVFGEELSYEEASRRAHNLINLYRVVYGAIARNKQ